MKPAILLAGVLLFSLLLAPVAVSASDPDAFLAAVEAKANVIKSFTCRFTQERHLAIFSKPVLFSGRLSMASPRQLRWEFMQPVPSVLALKGTTGLRCSNGKSQRFELSSDPMMSSVIEHMWAWMDGSYRGLKQNWQIDYLPDAPALTLVPKAQGAKSVMQIVRINFDRETLRPVEVAITDSGGDRTRLIFSDYVVNPALDSALFSQCDTPSK